MSRGDEDRARAALEDFLRLCKRPRRCSRELIAQGRAVRVLAASKPGGLLLNVEAPELGFFIADGMDITAQLVNVIRDPDVHAALKECLCDDIRISVHAQHPVAFLGDVRDHRFDLMIFGQLDPPAARLAAAALAPGGILGVFGTIPSGDADGDGLAQTLTACGLLTAPARGRSLIAARAPAHLKTKRRGGRRNRPPRHG